jgi:two-component system cell cycle response regulator DivK
VHNQAVERNGRANDLMNYQETGKIVEGRGERASTTGRAGSQPSAGERQRLCRPNGKSVMIVEDNELNMKLFHDLLDAHGYRTIQTRSGLDALPLAREHRPDLILMDIQLPEVSGLEVTKWLKDDDELRAIPVVAVTAFAMKGDEERIRSGGCEAYISKPISVATFLDVVARYSGKAAA